MEYIIVLGNRDTGTMERRVDRAIKEFNSNICGVQKKLIFSGGYLNENKSGMSEALFMQDYAIDVFNIDKKSIITENKSKTTLENIKNVNKILNQIGSNPINDTLVICTSKFHINRVIMLSKLLFPTYKVRFVFTDEEVSINQENHEKKLLMNFIEMYCKTILG
jgi:uncharacterized SAM-binding protein YcdF (DUF218 family)